MRIFLTIAYNERRPSKTRDLYVEHIFCSYEIRNKVMWLLGGINKQEFLKDAIYYEAGAWVCDNYQIREGHEIYSIEIAKLLSCKAFAQEIGIVQSDLS